MMTSAAIREFAESVVAKLRGAGYRAVFAGGCVRDLLLGVPPKDYDVATDARPEQIREIFGKRRTLAVGESFGVVMVIPSRRDRARGIAPVEVATFRTESDYRDGRHPDHVAFATAEEDARRRDFTINGMFLDPIDDRVLDYVGGRADLENGRVRAIGDPRARMGEDKLRLLRAIRFTAALGFEMDPETSAAVAEMAGSLTVVSAERIAQELRRMLVHPSRARATELCRIHGLLPVMFPEVTAAEQPEFDAWQTTLRRLNALTEPSFETSLAGLMAILPERDRSADVPSEILRRLRLSNAECERITWLLERFGILDEFPRMTLAQAKRLAAHPGMAELMDLERARVLAAEDDPAAVEACAAFLARTPPEAIDPPPLLTGGDLIKLGLRPGPEFGRLLEAARDAQLNETISNPQEAIALVKRLQS